MRKLLLVICAALALCGCNRGGTSDESSTSTGSSAGTNQTAPSTSSQISSNNAPANPKTSQ